MFAVDWFIMSMLVGC